jgi:hypothetical protein
MLGYGGTVTLDVAITFLTFALPASHSGEYCVVRHLFYRLSVSDGSKGGLSADAASRRAPSGKSSLNFPTFGRFIRLSN